MNINTKLSFAKSVQRVATPCDDGIERSCTENPAFNKFPILFPVSRFKPILWALMAFSFLFNFTSTKKPEASACLNLPTDIYASIKRNGKLDAAEQFNKTFVRTDWEDLGFPVITEELKLALQHQLHVLDKTDLPDTKNIGNLDVTYGGLRDVIEILIQRTGTQPNDLNQYLEAWQTWGDDQMGNVYFTGYFTPVLKVKQQKDDRFKYPIYAFPENWKGKLPSRREIDEKGALDRFDELVLAYASNPLDVYFMQLQGSGTVEYLDTKERTLLRYAGENGRPYRNIQNFFKGRNDLSLNNLTQEGIRRFLVKYPQKMDSVLFYDPSYTFFTPKKGLAKGAADVPLMKDISIAADSRYFPLGSVVLAAMPVYENGRITHHEYKILLPQDVGGAIKGVGHVDVYCGNGQLGQNNSSNLHHYGRLWVLLPKKNEQMALAE